ncbi:MAG: histidine--tRNA ligase [Candidatus Moranbacteria bacterium]|nr:histidine--tRNA ligase [Candidatus Moranbacteria bacterium]
MNNKNLIEAERPGGFLDFLPAEYLAREKMLNIITKTFRSFGFDSMETSIVEFEKTLKGEESETGKQIFSIMSSDTKGESLNLRFDHTVPFARILAANPYNAHDKTGIKLPFKRMVLGPVFRGERPQQGRYRQFYQFDIDIAGSDLMLADAEVLTLMYQTMKNLGVENFVIRVNNRKVFQALSDLVRMFVKNDDETATKIDTEIIRVIDKVDKIGIDGIFSELNKKLLEEFKLSEDVIKNIIKKVKTLLLISGNNFEKLDKCEELFKNSEKAQEGITELREVFELLKKSSVDEKNIVVDFSIARGLDYYTGTVMETNLLDAPEFGSVFSGGRYNKLLERFTGQELPVVGTSIGVDRLFVALDKLNLLDQSEKISTDVMVLRLSDKYDDKYFDVVQKIREAGMNATICFLGDTTFKRQFNFALNSGVKFVVIMGEDEISENILQVKNLETREQVEVELGEVEGYFDKVNMD